MLEGLDVLLKDFTVCGAFSPVNFQELESKLDISLPKDYRGFLIETNGGEGFVGYHYLMAWRLQELLQFNDDYQVKDLAPGIFIFGSNGSGEGFGFDTRDSSLPIVQVPFIGLDLSAVVRVADNFHDLLKKMVATNGSLLSNEKSK